jgi:hypothetical protein
MTTANEKPNFDYPYFFDLMIINVTQLLNKELTEVNPNGKIDQVELQAFVVCFWVFLLAHNGKSHFEVSLLQREELGSLPVYASCASRIFKQQASLLTQFIPGKHEAFQQKFLNLLQERYLEYRDTQNKDLADIGKPNFILYLNTSELLVKNIYGELVDKALQNSIVLRFCIVSVSLFSTSSELIRSLNE